MRVLLSYLTFLIRLIRRFSTLIAVLALVISIGLNFAVLTMSGVFAAASAVLSSAGVTTVAARQAGDKLAHRRATTEITRQTAAKVTARVQKGAARNMASVAGEAIPVVGIAVIAGALAYDVADACETARDIEGLEAALLADKDPELALVAARDAFDCRSIIPNYDDLPKSEEIYATMRVAPQQAWDMAAVQIDRLKSIDYMPAPGVWDGVASYVSTLPGFDRLKLWWFDEERRTP